MRLRLAPVDEGNRAQAEALRVAQGQEGFIETVADCLAEADELPCWRPAGIYDGEKLVGFAMYCQWNEDPDERVWLDRFLISHECQGRGYGHAALALLLDRLEEEYGPRDVYLSVIPGNGAAQRLYREFGFRYNGELDIHGERVMVRERPRLEDRA